MYCLVGNFPLLLCISAVLPVTIGVDCYICGTSDNKLPKPSRGINGASCYDPVKGEVGSKPCPASCYLHKLTVDRLRGKEERVTTSINRGCNTKKIQIGCSTDITLGQQVWNETYFSSGTVTAAEICACTENLCNGKSYIPDPGTKSPASTLYSSGVFPWQLVVLPLSRLGTTRPMNHFIALSALLWSWLPVVVPVAIDIGAKCYICNTKDFKVPKSRQGPSCYDPVEGQVATKICKDGCYLHKLTANAPAGKEASLETSLFRDCVFNKVQTGCSTDVANGQNYWNLTNNGEGTVIEAEVCACNKDLCNGKVYGDVAPAGLKSLAISSRFSGNFARWQLLSLSCLTKLIRKSFSSS